MSDDLSLHVGKVHHWMTFPSGGKIDLTEIQIGSLRVFEHYVAPPCGQIFYRTRRSPWGAVGFELLGAVQKDGGLVGIRDEIDVYPRRTSRPEPYSGCD